MEDELVNQLGRFTARVLTLQKKRGKNNGS